MILPKYDFQNETFLVTGGSSGIGRQVCVELAQNNANVIVVGRNEEHISDTKKLLDSERHIFYIYDLSKKSAIIELVGIIPELRGLICSAGTVDFSASKFVSEEKLGNILQINYSSVILLVSELLKKRKLLSSSSVVFISSIMANLGIKGNVLYAGSKGALLSSSRVIALELAAQKIRVNTILPGMVKTPMYEQTVRILGAKNVEKDEEKYPLGYGEPIDVANLCLFLLSDASKWITGSSITIDGGFSIS